MRFIFFVLALVAVISADQGLILRRAPINSKVTLTGSLVKDELQALGVQLRTAQAEGDSAKVRYVMAQIAVQKAIWKSVNATIAAPVIAGANIPPDTL